MWLRVEGLICVYRTRTRAESPRAEDGRFEGDHGTVGVVGGRAGVFSSLVRTVFEASAGVNSSPLRPKPCLSARVEEITA